METSHVDLLIIWELEKEEQMLGLHLSIHMGYVESATLFCAATETVKEMNNNTLYERGKALENLMETLEEIQPPGNDPPRTQ